MKIRIIDFLNMYVQEKKPKRFIWNNTLWYLGNSDKEHYYCNNGMRGPLEYFQLDNLEDEVEIIEEEEK